MDIMQPVVDASTNRRYSPEFHHRRFICLKGYDFAQLGAYFVTIVTQGRMHLFGEIVDCWQPAKMGTAGMSK